MTKIVKTNLEIEDWFAQLPSKVDLWITDPPYPFDNKNGTARFNYSSNNDGMYKRLTWDDIGSFFKASFDESNDGARLYMFCNRDGIKKMWDHSEAAGWTVRNLLIWNKKRMGMGYHWRNQAEYILYSSKGKPKVYVTKVGNILSYKKPSGLGQSAKPFEIWRDILNSSLCDDDVCADPFAGSDPLSTALNRDVNFTNKIKKAHVNIY